MCPSKNIVVKIQRLLCRTIKVRLEEQMQQLGLSIKCAKSNVAILGGKFLLISSSRQTITEQKQVDVI